MIYLDDLAVWVRTQKGSILRGVLCGVIGIIAVAMLLSSFKASKELETKISDQNEEIKLLTNQISRKDNDIKSFADNELLLRASMSAPGMAVAKLQTEYGSFKDTDDINKIQQKVNEIQTNLKEYLKQGESYDDWFVNKRGRYLWNILTTDNYVTNNKAYLDGWFECSNANTADSIYAITLGKYDFNENMFYDLVVYTTNVGYGFLKSGTVGDVGRLFKFRTNDEYYTDYIAQRGMPPAEPEPVAEEGTAEAGAEEGTEAETGDAAVQPAEGGNDILSTLITEQTAESPTEEETVNPEMDSTGEPVSEQQGTGDELLDAVLTQ